MASTMRKRMASAAGMIPAAIPDQERQPESRQNISSRQIEQRQHAASGIAAQRKELAQRQPDETTRQRIGHRFDQHQAQHQRLSE